jgi:hypothetical protein
MPGPFDDLIPAQKKPAFTGYIPGTPDPYRQSAEDRALEDQRMQRERDARQIENDRLKNEKDRFQLDKDKAAYAATGGVDASVEQGKAAGFALRAERANKAYEGAKLDPDSMIGKFGNAVAPDITASFSNDDRNAQRSREKDFIAALLRYESGAAIPPSEYGTAYQIYFPSPNAGPKEIEAKRIARANAIEGLRLGAGPNVARIDAMPSAAKSQELGIVIDPAQADENGVIINPAPNTPDMTGGVPTGTDVRFGFQGSEGGFDRTAYLASIGLDPNKEATLMAGLNAITGDPELTADDMIKVYADIGAPLPNAADFQKQLEFARKGYRFGPVDSSVAEADNKQVADEAAAMDAGLGEAGLSELTQQGMMIGLGDEAAGVGIGFSRLLQGENPVEGYRIGRDAQRLRLDQAREREGVLGTAAEIAGGGASFGTAALTSTVPQTTRQLVNSGALQGALSGFGYGEGAGGSALGASGGALLGAGATFGLTKGAQFVGSRIGRKATAEAIDTARAANEEGLVLPRAILDPNAGVRATALDSTMAGRPVIDRTMKGVADAVEGRVGNLSAGNVIPDGENVGNLVRTAAERSIKDSGVAANRAYTKAENLAGDAKVAPTNALASIKSAVDELSETSGLNIPEINFLKTLEADFSKDLSVGALRRARTKMRKLISKGELTFGESEARVLGIMESAADDIRSGLSAQGKADAARAFDVADKGYRERMEYINGTLQKLIGRRQDNFSGETIAKKLAAMRGKGGDAGGLRKFFTTLDPDEKADIAATVADGLGKNRKGEFSLAILANNIENLPASARATIFGADGAKSLANLKTIATAFDKVKRNTSNTGLGNDWRSILGSVVFGGGVPLVAGGGGGTAAALAVTAGGAKLGRDYVSARMAMSPKFQRWLGKAVIARTPQQIADSMRGLNRIAATEPAIGGEVNALSNYLLQAANDTGPMAAAANSDRKEP